MNIDFEKLGGLVPAIIQDSKTHRVLMLGFMNQEAFLKTQQEKKVTFFSRTKQRLWTKGETSGHYLEVKEIKLDCDQDTLLIQANPQGPTCHKGDDTCFQENNVAFSDENCTDNFLVYLQKIIQGRKETPQKGSYTSSLFEKGLNRIVQKVGEEAIEVVISSKENDLDDFNGECADLLFHLLVLLQEKGSSLENILQVLKQRHQK